VFLVARPAPTIVFLFQALGVYWLVSGVFHAAASLFGTREQAWWTRLLGGILLAGIGVLVFSYPAFSAAVSAATLTMFLASLAVLGGIMTMLWGFSLSGEIPGEGWSILSGLLSVILGIAIFTAPYIALRGLSILAGIFAFAGGIGDIVFGFRLRSLGKRFQVKRRVNVPLPR
jgi:uncharacterized membrane protein HdeD (DUF308 family)